MRQWFKASNGFCLAGTAGITAGLWQLGIGWALGFLGAVALGFGVFLERKGM